MDQAESAAPKVPPAVFVRLTPEQYRHLANDAEVLGKSVPRTLLDGYFMGPPISPLVAKTDLQRLMAELSRIGNNVNQITHRVNCGEWEKGTEAVLNGFIEELTALRTFFAGVPR